MSVYFYKGKSLFSLNLYLEAIQSFDKAIQMNQNNFSANYYKRVALC